MDAENTTIQGLINMFLIIIPLGAAARCSFCALSMMHDDEERSKNKRRAKNALYFAIVAECAMAIVKVAYNYYS